MECRCAHVHPDFIKFFVDGVPTPPWFTSSALDPNGRIETHKLLIEPAELEKLLIRFDAQGLKAKLHISGDGASHVAIDAIAAARRSNPRSRIRHDTRALD